jgi:hypothetical protein
MLIVALYVDDFYMVGIRKLLDWFKSKFVKWFAIKWGKVEHVLGIQVTQSPTHISLSQSTYVLSILPLFGMENSHPLSLPVSGGDIGATHSSFI